jgi:hypothetical protein
MRAGEEFENAKFVAAEHKKATEMNLKADSLRQETAKLLSKTAPNDKILFAIRF